MFFFLLLALVNSVENEERKKKRSFACVCFFQVRKEQGNRVFVFLALRHVGSTSTTCTSVQERAEDEAGSVFFGRERKEKKAR